MSCTNCSSVTNSYCRVCQLLDNDNTIKKVKFCGFCNAHICESCEGDIGRRFEAFKKAKVGALKDKWNQILKSYE